MIRVKSGSEGGFREVMGVLSVAKLTGGWSGHTKFGYFFDEGFQSGRITVGSTFMW